MDILINELSLDSQFKNEKDFFDNMISILELIKIIKKLDFQILKDQMLFDCKITLEYKLIDFLKLKTNEARRFKSHLSKLSNNPPFWQNDQKHNCDKDNYFYNNKDVCSTSLAESIERDKIILSFKHNNYLKELLEIKKNNYLEKIFNITKKDNFLDYLYNNHQILALKYCSLKFERSNLNFENIDSEFGFKILDNNQIKEFINTFLIFSNMNWNEISKSDGLKYKKYTPNKRNNWFGQNYSNKKIYKFRVSEKYRCFGYKEENVFYILRFEIDHKQSDNG